MNLTIDVKQREQRRQSNEEKTDNSCTTKKNIAGFYTEHDKAACSLVPRVKKINLRLPWALKAFFSV